MALLAKKTQAFASRDPIVFGTLDPAEGHVKSFSTLGLLRELIFRLSSSAAGTPFLISDKINSPFMSA